MGICDYCFDKSNDCKGITTESRCEHRNIHAVIRITTKCTQSCGHCCFACSPQCNTHMTIAMSKLINQFLISNNILSINIMGGEFFCNPHFVSIIKNLSKGMSFIRLTTNGDWSGSESMTTKVMNLCKKIPNIKVSISCDKYHTNTFVEKARKACIDNGITHDVNGNSLDEVIVPVKKGSFHSGFFPSIGCYCKQPKCSYTFLIDEQGGIFYCPFGIWKYDKISNYLNGQFSERFKEVKGIFRKSIHSCDSCVRSYNRIGKEFESDTN